jgi:hypothetical protein
MREEGPSEVHVQEDGGVTVRQWLTRRRPLPSPVVEEFALSVEEQTGTLPPPLRGT